MGLKQYVAFDFSVSFFISLMGVIVCFLLGIPRQCQFGLIICTLYRVVQKELLSDAHESKSVTGIDQSSHQNFASIFPALAPKDIRIFSGYLHRRANNRND